MKKVELILEQHHNHTVVQGLPFTHILVFGNTRSGKTSFVNRYLRINSETLSDFKITHCQRGEEETISQIQEVLVNSKQDGAPKQLVVIDESVALSPDLDNDLVQKIQYLLRVGHTRNIQVIIVTNREDDLSRHLKANISHMVECVSHHGGSGEASSLKYNTEYAVEHRYTSDGFSRIYRSVW